MTISTKRGPLASPRVAMATALALLGDLPQLPGDLNGDCYVELGDLAILLSNYAVTGGAQHVDGDLDGNGDVDLADLSALLAVCGTTCD